MRIGVLSAVALLVVTGSVVASASAAEPAALFGFTGHEYDPKTGLYYMKGRFYDPSTGRFISADPESGDPTTPPSLHKYVYAYANPTVYTDPTGRYSEAAHYYTPYYVALRVGMTPEDARTLAFYSQVPDEVSSLDAIANQVSAGLEKGRDFVPGVGHSSEARDRRDISQQSLHALTGTNSAFESRRAHKAIVDAPTLSAAGLSVHRLGDTFSHRQLGGEETLYLTGPGHGGAGTAPDTIQQRPDLYLQYVRSLADALKERCGAACRGSDTDDIVETLRIVTELPPGVEVPARLDLSGHDQLATFAAGQVRALLQLESDWGVASGHEPLDLSFRPEEFDVPHLGDKSASDLLREMEEQRALSPSAKADINESELAEATARAYRRYQSSVFVVKEGSDGLRLEPVEPPF